MKKNKCSYSKKYKAKIAPKCGCQTCNDKWKIKPNSKFLPKIP